MEKQVVMKNKCQIKIDDKVKVVTGKDKGKIGKVLKVIRKNNRIIIESINMVKRHAKPNASNRQGGILDKEAPIHRSNVMLMCNKCLMPVRIQMKRLENEKKVRTCRKCGEIIDS